MSSLVKVAVLLVFLSSVAAAQTTGTILGTVLDPSGAAVSNVTVKTENLRTGLIRTSVTTTEGGYLVPALPLGVYRLVVEEPGFKTFVQTGITLDVNQNARVDVSLQVGDVKELVTVSSNAAAVDTESSTVGATVDNIRLQNLPLNGRNVLSLAQLLPGVGGGGPNVAPLATDVTFGRGGPGISVSGGRVDENTYLLDGTSIFDAIELLGENLPSPDALQEFRVLTNSFDAEYGQAGGGVFLAVTKSGTNQLHGTLFDYLRNDALDATNYFATTKPYLRQNQFGASLGGPVELPFYRGKDRTFFFVSYQGLRIQQQNLIAYFPATAAERKGDFSASTQPIIDPTTGLPFPGNIIPASRFDPLSVNMLADYVPLPNLPNGELAAAVPAPTSGNQISAKVDESLTNNNHLNVRFYHNKDVAITGGGVSAELAGPQSTATNSWSALDTHVFRPTLLNELHGSYTTVDWRDTPSAANKTPTELGAVFNQDGNVAQAPYVSVAGRFDITPQGLLNEPDSYYQFDDKLSWIRGRHSLRFGTEIQHIFHQTLGSAGSSGTGTFDGSFTGNAMADFLIGRPINFGQQNLLSDQSVSKNFDFFAQDDFKISKRVTLNLGLRYELNTPWVQIHNEQSEIRPGEQSTVFPAAPPGLVFPGDPGVPRGLIKTDKTNFTPRVGFAWDPFGKGTTSVRAGYGVFTVYTGAGLSSIANQTPPYIVPVQIASPPSFSNPFYPGTSPFPFTFNPTNPIFFFPVKIFTTKDNFRDGYVQQFNLNLQHQFKGDLVVQAGYVGNVGTHLHTVSTPNAAVYGPGATAENIQARRPYFPQYYSDIIQVTSDANSDYHSLQLSVDKKYSRDFTMQLAYTYGKSIDDKSDYRTGSFPAQDPNNYLRGNRGLSDWDQRNILAINGVWDLPFLKNNGLLTTLFGGWRIAGIFRYGSGNPVNILSGQDFALVGAGNGNAERPDQIGDPNLSTSRPRKQLIAEWFNPAAFVPNKPGEYGDTGRNSVEGPPFTQTDFDIVRQFKFPNERLGHMEFRADLFNLFNQVNFGPPVSTLVSPAFGQITSAGDPRIVQLALRYEF
jgi:Carboxypeptidase regulatory-like domain/TonB dependent receptor